MLLARASVAAVLALGTPGVAWTQQSHFTRLAQDALRSAVASWSGRGFVPIGALWVGTLAARERDSLALQLESRGEYVVLGMCDEDCGDLDLRLDGPDDKQVAFDAKSNARPVVGLTAPSDGIYRLQVVMLECSTPPCYYGVQLLRKTTGSGDAH